MKKLVFLILLVTNLIQSQNITAFYLSRYSPAIDRGTMDVWPLVGPTDFYRNPRLAGKSVDIGVAEFQDLWPRIVKAKVNANAKIKLGSSIELMASGGEQYTWTTGDTTRVITVTPLVTTTYTVRVEEYGVFDIAKVTVTVVDPTYKEPIANIGNDIVQCSNNQILLMANGSDTANYLWSTGETTKSILVNLINDILITVEIAEPDGITDSDSVMIYVNQGCN